jgi:hypothetical protein
MVTVMDCRFFVCFVLSHTKGRASLGVPCFILNMKCNEALMTAISRLLGLVCMQLCNLHTQEYSTERSICLG